jgi:glycerate-2-kinase
MKNLTAKINTKSNYRNLNGTIQHVSEIKGNRVSCKIWDETISRFITSDFVLNEVELNY